MPITNMLRSIRETRGATLREYSDALEISEGQLSRIERGLIDSIDVKLAFRIRDVYGVPVEAWARDAQLPDEDLERGVREDPRPQDVPQADPTAGLTPKEAA